MKKYTPKNQSNVFDYSEAEKATNRFVSIQLEVVDELKNDYQIKIDPNGENFKKLISNIVEGIKTKDQVVQIIFDKVESKKKRKKPSEKLIRK